jgi:outer membrane protein TolC
MGKYLKHIFVLLFFISLPTLDLQAQEILTWEDCVKEATQNNPDLISSAEKLVQAKTNLTGAKSSYLPQINGSAGAQESKTEGLDKNQSYNYGISGRQLLFDGLKTNYDIATASENVKQSLYNYEVTSSNIRLRLRAAFINLLKAQQSLTITEAISAKRKDNLTLVNLSYEAGQEHKGSLLTAQADLDEAEFEVAQAKRSITLAQIQLAQQLGRTKYGSIELKSSLDVAITDIENPNFDEIADNTPLLQGLISQEESARLGVKSATADFYPQVYASASAGRSADTWPPDTSQWSAGVNLTVPIFSGGSQVAGLSKAKSALRQAEADKNSGRAGVIFTLAQTWNNFQDALGQISVQQKFLTASQERAKIAEAQYKIGLMSFDNWIIIEDDLINTQKNLLNAQANALLAEANWMQAKGVILDLPR